MACAPLLTSGDVLRRLLEAGRGFSLPPAQHADRLRMLEKVKGVHVVAVASALTRLGVYISGVAIATSIANTLYSKFHNPKLSKGKSPKFPGRMAIS